MVSLLQIIVGAILSFFGWVGKALGYIPILVNTSLQGFQFIQSMLEFIPAPLLGIASLTLMITFSLLIIKIIKLVM